MRLFTAIRLPERVKKIVSNLQSEIPRDTGKFNLVEPSQAHMTLKFLGDVDNPEDIEKRLEKVEFDKFELETNGLGFFPNDSFIKVFWMGLEGPEELYKLSEGVRNELSEFKDRHDFHPHVTLARVKNLWDKDVFKQAVEEMKVPKESFEVTSYSLMKSELTSEGPVYEEIRNYGCNS